MAFVPTDLLGGVHNVSKARQKSVILRASISCLSQDSAGDLSSQRALTGGLDCSQVAEPSERPDGTH